MITIEHYPMVDYSPALVMVHEGCLDLAKKGFMQSLHVYWEDKVIALKDDDKIIGVLTWRVLKSNQALWISLSYIHPDHRGKGYYKKMYEELKGKCREEKMMFIDSGTNVYNLAAQQAFKNAGRTLDSYSYRDRIE